MNTIKHTHTDTCKYIHIVLLKYNLNFIVFHFYIAELFWKQTAHAQHAHTQCCPPHTYKYRNMCLYVSNKHAQVKNKTKKQTQTHSNRKRSVSARHCLVLGVFSPKQSNYRHAMGFQVT